MKNLIGLLLTFAVFVGANAQFEGDYDPANWTSSTGANATGVVDFSGAPGTLIIAAPDENGGIPNGGNPTTCGGNGVTSVCITVCSSGDMVFDWDYAGFETSNWDPFGYCIDDNFTLLTAVNGPTIQSGSEVIAITAGQEFCFAGATTDGAGAEASVTMTNFTGPGCCPSDFELAGACNAVDGESYITVNAIDLGIANPSGYTVAINGADDGIGITAPGVYTYGPFNVVTTVDVVGIDDALCQDSFTQDCTCDPLAVHAGLNVDPIAYDCGPVDISATLGDVIPGTFLGYTENAGVDCAITSADALGAVTVVSLGDDAISAAITIPFPFNFFGTPVSDFIISSNGFISFGGTTNDCCTGEAIPNGSSPNNMVALFWEDLDPDSGNAGTIQYYEVAAGMVIEFIAVQHFPSGTPVSGYILLGNDNSVTINCIDCQSDGGTHTSGIENSDGTEGYFDSVASTNGTYTTDYVGCITFEEDNSPSVPCTFLGWSESIEDAMTGTYIDVLETTTVMPIGEQTYYAMTDCNGVLCYDEVTVESLEVVAIVIDCDEAGTLTTAADDLFSFEIDVTNVLPGTYTLSGAMTAGIETGSYGAVTAFGPYPIVGYEGVTITLDVVDTASGSCMGTLNVDVPITCSPPGAFGFAGGEDVNGNIIPPIDEPCECYWPDYFTETLSFGPDAVDGLVATWRLENLTGFYSSLGTNYAAPVPVDYPTDITLDPNAAIPAGASFNLATGLWTLDGFHESLVGYSVDVYWDQDGAGPGAEILVTSLTNVCDYTSESCAAIIPTASEWGLIALALSLMSIVLIYVRRREYSLATA